MCQADISLWLCDFYVIRNLCELTCMKCYQTRPWQRRTNAIFWPTIKAAVLAVTLSWFSTTFGMKAVTPADRKLTQTSPITRLMNGMLRNTWQISDNILLAGITLRIRTLGLLSTEDVPGSCLTPLLLPTEMKMCTLEVFGVIKMIVFRGNIYQRLKKI